MPWLPLPAYFFSGVFLANAIPHFVSGMMGRSFQSPFARPPGEEFSSSTVNLLWGFANFLVFYLLVRQVGDFNLGNSGHAAAFGLGILILGLFAARHFGRFDGGNTPGRP